MHHFINILPRETIDTHNAAQPALLTPSGKKEAMFNLNLEIKTYTRIFEYLIKQGKVEHFQWCLDNFGSNIINSDYLIDSMIKNIDLQQKE